MVGFSGWLMPVQYSSIVAEHQATRSAVGLFDISHMGRLYFRGPGAKSLLDRLLTRRISNIATGQIRYSLVTNDHGGVLDDVLLYCLEGSDGVSGPLHLLVVNAGNREKITDWISGHMSGVSDVEFEDQTTTSAMIAVQGPAASVAVASLVGPSVTQLKYYTGAQMQVTGHDGIVSRTGYTGEDGYELIVPASAAEEIWEKLVTASALPAGLGARDTLRLEAGMPLYGHELTEEINPYQAGLGFAIQLKDRDFIGRDALEQLRSQPQLARRIGLELAGRRVPREGYAVLANGGRVGEITSGTFSPTLERPIAMAYVRPEVAELEMKLDVEIRGRNEPATVVKLPFYSRPQD